jgi:hypothetical protein
MSQRKIAVVGNCTATMIANCIRALRPEDNVRPISVTSAAALATQAFDDFDFAFVVANAGEFFTLDRLARRGTFLTWPNIVFFGFQPDITYFAIEGRPVRSAMGEYSSHIISMGYAQGLSPQETARLFNRLVYARLGFFDKYSLSRAALLVAGERCGMDLNEPMTRWERSGVFMHSINHPKVIVLADIAKALLKNANLPFDPELPLADIVPDILANGGIWPVYPDLARAIGVAGSLTFAPPTHGSYDPEFLSLEGFIEKTFAIYHADGFSRAMMRDLAGIQQLLAVALAA